MSLSKKIASLLISSQMMLPILCADEVIDKTLSPIVSDKYQWEIPAVTLLREVQTNPLFLVRMVKQPELLKIEFPLVKPVQVPIVLADLRRSGKNFASPKVDIIPPNSDRMEVTLSSLCEEVKQPLVSKQEEHTQNPLVFSDFYVKENCATPYIETAAPLDSCCMKIAPSSTCYESEVIAIPCYDSVPIACDPCGYGSIACDPCGGAFFFDASWIYFSPVSETTYYAVQAHVNNTGPIVGRYAFGERFANKFTSFYSGWRLLGGYVFDECADSYVAFKYTQLKAHHSDSAPFNSAGLLPTNIPKDVQTQRFYATGSASHKFAYYSFEGVFGLGALHCQCYDFDFFGGVHYANIRSHDCAQFTNPGIVVFGTNDDTYWGVGPELGCTVDRDFACGFSFTGQITSAFLIGKPKSSLFAVSSDIPTKPLFVFNDSNWRVVPFADVRLGMKYDLDIRRCFSSLFNCGRSIQCALEFGYEALTYFNAISQIELITPGALLFAAEGGFSFDYFRNITMHGPYLSLSLTY